MIQKFIKENNITFNEGERNSSVVTCIGYAQFKELDKQELIEELEEEIAEDDFIEEEIDRLSPDNIDNSAFIFFKKIYDVST